MKHKYETLLLFDPELSVENRKEIQDNLAAVIDRDGGRVLEVDEWGMRDLAYPVRKVSRGFYTRLEFVLGAEFTAELERNIRIADGIFKFLTVKLADNADA
jgi:small subunit ribosomal protein S6